MTLTHKLIIILVCAAAALVVAAKAFGHDYEHADHDAWYSSLKMPDAPTTSCCGKHDAYWADQTDECRPGVDVVRGYWAQDCFLVAIITDSRHIDGRYPYPVGTRIAVPKHKMRKVASNNPTDHTIIFLSPAGDGWVYCYEPQTLL